jgi:hypothetical protein
MNPKLGQARISPALSHPFSGTYRLLISGRVVIAGLVASVSATSLIARAPQQGPFQLSCTTLPFETIKKDRPIDDLCDRGRRRDRGRPQNTEPRQE